MSAQVKIVMQLELFFNNVLLFEIGAHKKSDPDKIYLEVSVIV